MRLALVGAAGEADERPLLRCGLRAEGRRNEVEGLGARRFASVRDTVRIQGRVHLLLHRQQRLELDVGKKLCGVLAGLIFAGRGVLRVVDGREPGEACLEPGCRRLESGCHRR